MYIFFNYCLILNHFSRTQLQKMTTSLICQCTHVFTSHGKCYRDITAMPSKKFLGFQESVFNKIVMVNIVLSIQTMHYIRIDRYRYSDSIMSKTDRAAEPVWLETDKCHCLQAAIFSAIWKRKKETLHFLHYKQTDQNTVVTLLTIAIKKRKNLMIQFCLFTNINGLTHPTIFWVLRKPL